MQKWRYSKAEVEITFAEHGISVECVELINRQCSHYSFRLYFSSKKEFLSAFNSLTRYFIGTVILAKKFILINICIQL